MLNISIKLWIRNKIDSILHIDRRGEYGYMAADACISPDVMVFSKKFFCMRIHPFQRGILNPCSKFIMKRGSFVFVQTIRCHLLLCETRCYGCDKR